MPQKLLVEGLHTKDYLKQLKVANGNSAENASDPVAKIQIELEVSKGTIELVKIQQQPYVGFLRPSVDSSVASAIQGLTFGPHLPDIVRNKMSAGIFEDCDKATQSFLVDCVGKMIRDFA